MLNWIVSSVVLIVGIMVLRFFIKGKISLRIQYSLWAIVLLRLLIPCSIGETTISVENWLRQLPQKEVHQDYEVTQPNASETLHQEVKKPYTSQKFDIELMPEDVEVNPEQKLPEKVVETIAPELPKNVIEAILPELSETVVEAIPPELLETVSEEQLFTKIAKGIWKMGVIIVGLCFLFTNLRFQQKLLKNRKVFLLNTEQITTDSGKYFALCKNKLPIYLCDEVETPCLFGLIHPSIYVTSEVVKDERILRHVIAHETTHYLHGDYIWGYLRVLCLTMHWYNPLVWYAAHLSRNDAELACDEAAIARLGEGERASYGRTLIGLTFEKHTEVMLTATTMTGNRKTIKERIYMIANKPKTKSYMVILVALATVLCVGCTFTGANTENSEQGKLQTAEKNGVESDQVESNHTEAVVTETEDASMETYFIELPAGLSEEEQEKLRLEMEQKEEEVEQKREISEKQAKFYQNKENGTLVEEEEIIERTRCLLQDEHKFEYKLMCESDYDGTQEKVEVNGRTVFCVEEATSWDYYEDLAGNYYSDEYIENDFTPFYLGTVYMEADGKLYRAFSDGIGTTLIDSSMKVWQGKDGKYYVSIHKESVEGEHPNGYVIGLAENSKYGFKILDKVILLDDNRIE